MGDVWVEVDELETLDVVVVVVVVVVATLDVVVTLADVWVLEVTEVCGGVTSICTTRAPGGSRFLGSGIASVWPGAIWANWVGGAKYVVVGGASWYSAGPPSQSRAVLAIAPLRASQSQ